MREIEFRGKRKDGKGWLYGNLIVDRIETSDGSGNMDGGKTDLIVTISNRSNSMEVIPETVGEYTGLKDKNGVKIFEEDIVLAGANKEKYIVRFCQGEYLLDASGNDCPCKMRENGRLSGQNTYYLKVIGNIHDSPELLGRE
jgi:uncharacterized phage protein (TIGR01671 family)